ncbi:ribonuclease H-like domain-containing protein [Cladorrhinum samala]|uniref:ribonuclease H n=1 Tax=Cladorrhinum samala TaxID=585594 RepID=A0AAV9HNC8_9PEZI|nr:ribonuclease H-like domain-containing protein [Cladorrhinum samala]
MDDPRELPDGRLVCGPHGRVHCFVCCVDYSFMDDIIEGEDDDSFGCEAEATDSHPAAGLLDHKRLRRGTDQAFPTKFVPPSATITPLELFSGRGSHMFVTRYTLRNDAGKALIRTDGACLDNGQQNPKAGWAFWHGLGPSGQLLVASGRLEKKGPFGDESSQTSNRAELRAVIAALRFRFWPGEGFHTLVVATDSEFVVEGSTAWARTWVAHGWVKREGGGVKNKDLWPREALLGEVEQWKDSGTAVEFWKIPREWNIVADAAAKEAAAEEEAPSEWQEYFGINI